MIRWVTIALITGCISETPCPAPGSVQMGYRDAVNTCEGVELEVPADGECMQNGYNREECAAEQLYRCGNGIELRLGVYTDTHDGFVLVRDTGTGCESWYPLEEVQ